MAWQAGDLAQDPQLWVQMSGIVAILQSDCMVETILPEDQESMERGGLL